MTESLTLRALAKINLDLRVLHKRGDGFHELRTVFQTISLSDRIALTFHSASTTSISIDGNVAIPDNLIDRAARLIFAACDSQGHLRVRLTKRIPMGAGLGGGSSDAAAILLSLPGLIGVVLPPEHLHKLAAELGSDVPFFLYGGAAVGIGRGEELFPLPDLPRFHGLLVTPNIHVSTVEAYRELSPYLANDSAVRKQSAFAQLAWTENLATAQNDFEAPVFARHPELAVIRAALAESGAISARMTGSGSSVFGLFPDLPTRAKARARLQSYPVVPFFLFSRARYRRLWQKQTSAAVAGLPAPA